MRSLCLSGRDWDEMDADVTTGDVCILDENIDERDEMQAESITQDRGDH